MGLLESTNQIMEIQIFGYCYIIYKSMGCINYYCYGHVKQGPRAFSELSHRPSVKSNNSDVTRWEASIYVQEGIVLVLV